MDLLLGLMFVILKEAIHEVLAFVAQRSPVPLLISRHLAKTVGVRRANPVKRLKISILSKDPKCNISDSAAMYVGELPIVICLHAYLVGIYYAY